MDLTQIGESCIVCPALVVFRGKLAIAWADDSDGDQIRVTLGDVPATGPFVFSSVSLGDATLRDPGLATFQGRLYLGFVGMDGLVHILSSHDGITFDRRIDLMDSSGTGVTLAANGTRLYATWSEAGTQQLVVTSTADGMFFDQRQVLPHTSDHTPGLALSTHPLFGQRLVLAWTGNDRSVRMVLGSPTSLSSLASGIMTLPVKCGAGPTLCAYFPVFSQLGEITIGIVDPTFFDFGIVSTDVDGSAVHFSTPEMRPGALTGGPGITDNNGVLLLAFADENADHPLFVGDHDAVYPLPADLRNQVGKECDPRNCTEDPRLVCVLTGETKLKLKPASIINGDRGFLVLTPADGEGVIGTILKSVSPLQFYDHMGVMVDDGLTIRHCTESKDRLQSENYYGGKLLGEPVPTDGLRPDLVKYGWPGPITQSIQNGFFGDGWNVDRFALLHDGLTNAEKETILKGMNPEWSFATLNSGMTPTTDEQKYGFVDPERPKDGYIIPNLTLAPSYRNEHPGGAVVWPLVVRPPYEAEDKFPWLRWLLGHIADEAVAMRGHYNFYAYSKASIAFDLGTFAPAPGDPSWASLPKGADWAAGTPSLCCSTFIWAAVQRATRGLQIEIFLEQTLEPNEQTRRQTLLPFFDGLYQYSEDERAKGAQNLHDWITNNVRAEVKRKVDKAFPVLARLGTSALLTMLIFPTGAAVLPLIALGLSPATIAALAVLFTDMPEQVANGICMAFALNTPEKIDSDDWKRPGIGVTVSPDDTGFFWDPPGQNPDFLTGPYGLVQKAIIDGQHLEEVLVGRLALSPGVASVHGHVEFEGQTLIGADVWIGCRKTRTNIDGFHLNVPASPPEGGKQAIQAKFHWTDAQGNEFTIRGILSTNLPVGHTEVGGIKLEMPPEWRRRVEVHGHLDMVHQVMLGHNTTDHPQFSQSMFLQYQPNWFQSPGYDQLADTEKSFSYRTAVCGGEHAELNGVIVLNPDFSVEVKWVFLMYDGTTLVANGPFGSFSVPKGQTKTDTLALSDHDIPPDRANFVMTVDNNFNPA